MPWLLWALNSFICIQAPVPTHHVKSTRTQGQRSISPLGLGRTLAEMDSFFGLWEWDSIMGWRCVLLPCTTSTSESRSRIPDWFLLPIFPQFTSLCFPSWSSLKALSVRYSWINLQYNSMSLPLGSFLDDLSSVPSQDNVNLEVRFHCWDGARYSSRNRI